MNSNFVENLRSQSVQIEHDRKESIFSNLENLIDYESSPAFHMTYIKFKDFFKSLIDQENVDLGSFGLFIIMIFGRFFK